MRLFVVARARYVCPTGVAVASVRTVSAGSNLARKVRELSKQTHSAASPPSVAHHGRFTDAAAVLQGLPFRRVVRGRRGGDGDFSGAGEQRRRLALLAKYRD